MRVSYFNIQQFVLDFLFSSQHTELFCSPNSRSFSFLSFESTAVPSLKVNNKHSCVLHDNTVETIASERFGVNNIISNALTLEESLKLKKHKYSPLLSAPLGMITSAYFFVYIAWTRKGKKEVWLWVQLHNLANLIWVVVLVEYVPTGRQNSSNAGLTRLMYCARTLSRSRPRSLISRSTENGTKKRL